MNKKELGNNSEMIDIITQNIIRLYDKRINEQNQKIDEQNQKIDELNQKNVDLEKRLQKLEEGFMWAAHELNVDK